MIDNLTRTNLTFSGNTIVCEYNIRPTTAIILHGAGQAERSRYYAFAHEFLRRDIGVVLFDFTGHGESSGKLEQLSLQQRKHQAQFVINQLCDDKTKLILVGFSMSGQTVCDLVAESSDTISAVLLGCPAFYTPRAYNYEFGNELFTQTIRQQNSWHESDAFLILKKFAGKKTVAIGDDDPVIPTELISELHYSVPGIKIMKYPGVGHQLATWLSNNPNELASLIDTIV